MASTSQLAAVMHGCSAYDLWTGGTGDDTDSGSFTRAALYWFVSIFEFAELICGLTALLALIIVARHKILSVVCNLLVAT